MPEVPAVPALPAGLAPGERSLQPPQAQSPFSAASAVDGPPPNTDEAIRRASQYASLRLDSTGAATGGLGPMSAGASSTSFHGDLICEGPVENGDTLADFGTGELLPAGEMY